MKKSDWQTFFCQSDKLLSVYAMIILTVGTSPLSTGVDSTCPFSRAMPLSAAYSLSYNSSVVRLLSLPE